MEVNDRVDKMFERQKEVVRRMSVIEQDKMKENNQNISQEQMEEIVKIVTKSSFEGECSESSEILSSCSGHHDEGPDDNSLESVWEESVERVNT